MNRLKLAIGDTHGNWDVFYNLFNNYDIEDADLFHVGDFNVGFGDPNQYLEELNALNNKLHTRNSTLRIIRGNHDNPHYFMGVGHLSEHLDNAHLAEAFYKLSSITLVEDNTIEVIDDKVYYFLGGAISADKYRIKDKTPIQWWKAEIIPICDFDFNGESKIDYVITHNAPTAFFPHTQMDLEFLRGLNPDTDDQTLIQHRMDIQQERGHLQKLYDILPTYRAWIYGHFHKTNRVFDDEKLGWNILLKIDEVYNFTDT